MKTNKYVIEKQVAEFRSNNGLGNSDAISLNSLLLRLNVITLFRPLSDNFSGMCLKDSSGHRFMLVNSNHQLGRQNFTIAHELYHLFIEKKPTPHKCNPGYIKSPIERLADMFASTLLMPKEGIYQLTPENELEKDNISIATILKLEQYFLVSHSALLIRLKEVELISEKKFKELSTLKIKESAKKFGYSTALYSKANQNLVIGDFGKKARILFEQEKISEGHYLELLSKITIDENQEN